MSKRKGNLLVATLVAVIALVLVSCAPAQPVSPPATSTPIAATPAPVTAPVTTPEDAAWAKVVAAAKKEGVVTVYSFYYVGDTGRALAKAFQERYGIRVEILASSGRQTVEKIRVEQAIKQPVADVVNAGTSSSTEISIAGFGENVSQEIPNLKDRSVFLVDPVYSPKGDVLFTSLDYVTPAVNTNLVKPADEPKSFKDFLDPKWKGHLLAVDPRGGGGGVFNIIATMRYFKILDDDYWRQLAPQMVYFGALQEQFRAVGRGEFKVALDASVSTILPLIAEGAPLKLVPLDEGTITQGESTIVIKGAPHPNAAKLFADWILSAEGQEVYVKAASLSSMRKGVPSYIIPAAKLTPKKIVNRTWDAAQASNDYLKAGVMDQIFGKK